MGFAETLARLALALAILNNTGPVVQYLTYKAFLPERKGIRGTNQKGIIPSLRFLTVLSRSGIQTLQWRI